jgi:hypothetical protein
MTGLTEVTPWMLASDPDAARLADHMRQTASSQCGKNLTITCLPTLLRDLDTWYERGTP